MLKDKVNAFIRNLGFEVHGVGYIQKLKNSDTNKSVWDKKLELFPDNLKTIFDVGANRGDSTEKYLAVFPSAVIHAFEPFPLSSNTFQNKHLKCKQVVFNEMLSSII